MAEIDKQLIEVLSVLSESVRFKILSLISSKGELTAKDILSEFDFTQPTLSHHMSCLTEAGLVNVERRGRFAFIESLKSGSKKTEKAKASFDNTDKELKKSKKKKKKDKGKKKKKD